jgi:two-component system nitrogen regulation sensor histidine kinase GlnL
MGGVTVIEGPGAVREAVLRLKAIAFEANPEPAMIIDAAGAVAAVNEAAEELFGQGLPLLARGGFEAAFPAGSPLALLLARCRAAAGVVRERGMLLAMYGHAPLDVAAAAAPLADGAVLLIVHPRGTLRAEQPTEAGRLRSAVGLGRMLAHEIKNPLAGIRGAAQLLKVGAGAEDIPLAQLIVDETGRIDRLVDRMQSFSDDAPPTRSAVNIHVVLDRVRALATSGVADGLKLREAYDPSLPAAWGEEDQLIQVFLNLVKNAAEAARARGDGRGEIGMATAWREGVRVRVGDGRPPLAAPLEVRVIDNGPGVPPAMREQLFEPFVTTKPFGAGLGLALTAKMVAAHEGLIDFESEPGRTVFRVLLPICPAVEPGRV